MKYRNTNIALLAFFQLLIFIVPLAVKAGHHHDSDSVLSSPLLPGNTISIEEHCYLCNFEFVTFFIDFLSAYLYFDQTCAADLTISIEPIFRNVYTYFLRRAPPQF